MTTNNRSFKNNEQCIQLIKQSMFEKMEPKMKKVLRTIPIQYREDVEQDLKLKMIISLENIKYEQIPSLYELLAEEVNLQQKLCKHDK